MGQGALNMGFWGPCSPNQVVCPGLNVAAGMYLAVVWDLAPGLEFAVGVENAPCKGAPADHQ